MAKKIRKLRTATASLSVTKLDLALAVAAATKLPVIKASGCVEALFTALHRGILERGHAEIRGFGSFTVVERAPRPARNPKNPSVPIMLPRRAAVKFSPGKILQAELSAAFAGVAE